MDNLKILVQAVLDKIKSRNNIKATLKELETLPLVVKITGILNASKTKSEIKKALKELENGTDSTIKVKAVLENKESLKQIKNAIGELDTKIDISADDKQLKNTSQSLEDVNKRSLATVASLRLMQEAMRGLEQASREMVSTAFSLNKQLTDLRLVTGDNYEDAVRTVHAYNDLAHELSSLTSQVLSASNDWLRQGKSVEETTELITQSIVLSKVGAMAAEDATKNLTSAMKGYKLEVSDVSKIVDKLTSIDLEAAASSSGLAEAMSRTASSAAIAGIEMDRLLGYLATVIEVTQKAPSSIGESFKTIFARMGNVKLGKFLDDDGEDISDVESILKHFGITLRDTKNEFRGFGDVLDDVSNQWSNYTDLEKRAIANAFAGVRQYENFLVLMEHHGTAIRLAGVSADSAGTSLKRFAIYEEGLEAKTNQLKNALESLSFNTLDDGFAKMLIDAGTATIKLIDNLNLLKSTLVVLAAVGAYKGISVITNSAKSLYNQVNQLNSAFNLMAGFSKASLPTEQFNQLIVATNGLNMSQMRLILTNKTLDDTQRVNLLTSRGLTKAEARQTLATLGLASAEGTATTATGFLTGAFKSLSAAFAANPLGFILVGLSTAYTVISAVTSLAEQSLESLRNKVSDTISTFDQSSDSIQTNISTLESLEERFKELSKGVSSHMENISLTGEEYTELKGIIEQLIAINPELKQQFDDGNLTLFEKNNLIREQIELQKELQSENNKILISSGNDVFKVTEKDSRQIISDLNAAKELQDIILNSQKGIQTEISRTAYGIAKQMGFEPQVFKDEHSSTKYYLSLDVNETDINAIQGKVANLQNQLKEKYSSVDLVMQATINEQDAYKNLSEPLQSFVDKISRDVDWTEFGGSFDNAVDHISSIINVVGKDADKVNDILFETAKLTDISKTGSVDEWAQSFNNAISSIITKLNETPELAEVLGLDNLSIDELKVEIPLAFDIDTSQQDNAVSRIEDIVRLVQESGIYDTNDKNKIDGLQESLSTLNPEKIDLISDYFKEASVEGKQAVITFVETDTSLKTIDPSQLEKTLQTLTGIGSMGVPPAIDLTKEELDDLSKSMQTAGQNAHDLTKALLEMSKSGKVDSESLKTIIDLYPEAIAYANDFAAMTSFVSDKITEQENIALQSYGNIITANDDAINAIINKSSTLPSALSNYYGADYNNFVKVANGKYSVEAQTVAMLSGLWAKYAGMSARTMESQILMLERMGGGTAPEANQQVYNELLLMKSMYDSISADFSNIKFDFGKESKSSSSGSKSSAPYNAAIESTKLLEAELQKINELLAQNDKLLNPDDENTDEQSKLLQSRIDLLKQQQSLLHQINTENRKDISVKVQELSGYGVKIKYEPEINLLEFEQSAREIQSILNNVKVGNVENTEKVKKNLEAMLDTIIKTNEASDKNSSQWLEIQQTIGKINLDLINLDYTAFVKENTKELENLNFELKLLGENDFDKKVEITARQLDLQEKSITGNRKELDKLTQLYKTGVITAAQFKARSAELHIEWQSGVVAAKQYSDSINQISLNQLNAQKSAVMDIVNLTKQLIQQEAKDQANILEAQTDELKEQNDLLNDRKKALDEELKLQKELADEAKKRLDNELDAYKKIIDAKKKALEKESDDRYYEQDLSAKQLEVQKIQDRLTELANNDSLSAKAEKAKLADELAKRQLELDNFTYDNDIKNQQSALDSELERFTEKNQAEKDAIDDTLAAYEKAHQSKLDMIDSQIEANNNMADRIREQIQDIQDRIANNGELTRQAMARIDAEGEALYKKLIDYNAIYGTGITEDITGAWEEYLRTVDYGNMTTLEYTRDIMRQILDLSQQIAFSQSSISSYGLQDTYDSGIRSYFEGQGYEVGWNNNTKQFSVGDKWFDSSPYTNLDGSLQATYQQLAELEKQLANLPKYDKGGKIHEDQLAIVHKGERVLTPKETQRYERVTLSEEEFNKMKSSTDLKDADFNKLMKSLAERFSAVNINRNHIQDAHDRIIDSAKIHLNNTINNDNTKSVEINQTFNGVTSEKFMNDLPKHMKSIADNSVMENNNKQNKAARAHGLTGGVRAVT